MPATIFRPHAKLVPGEEADDVVLDVTWSARVEAGDHCAALACVSASSIDHEHLAAVGDHRRETDDPRFRDASDFDLMLAADREEAQGVTVVDHERVG